MSKRAQIVSMAAAAAVLVSAVQVRAETEQVPPVTLGASVVTDTVADVAGGIKTGVRVLGKADMLVEVDGRVIGLEDATLFLNLQYVAGDGFSEELVGDTQIVSNIEASSALRPLEAWLQVPYKAGGATGTVTAGLIDLNGIFDVQDVGRLFLNSSFGIGPDFSQSGPNGPSIFPTTTLGAVGTFDIEAWSLRLGVFDALAGDPARTRRTVIRAPGRQGFLLIGEVDRSVGRVELQVGGWLYTERFGALAEFDAEGAPRQLNGNHGAYGQVEARLAGDEGGATLDGWVRAGIAQSRINPIGTYWGGGVTYGDERHRLGLAVAHARLGDLGRAALIVNGERPQDAETAIELTFSHQVTECLRVQPDLQYVIDPSFRRDIGDALALGVRVQIDLP